MKRLIVMIVAFGLTALAAFYVALAPHTPSSDPGTFNLLDRGAAWLIAQRGRSAAVMGLLGLGVVLTMLAAAVIGDDKPAGGPATSPRPRKRSKREDASPGPVWRPDPLAPEDRIASLRRRAANETGTEPTPLPSRPVALVRKPRERDRDWFSDRSWLGGLPRLGDAEWPRDANGTPLPFAAQIDLTELAAACPESPLPWDGSLAFFLGTGAVVSVPAGEHDFSEPPQDLPPAFDEGGYPFPARAGVLSRYFFPFWPVDPFALDLPDDLRDHRDAKRDKAIEQAMANLLSHHVAPRRSAFTAEGETLWWHGVSHLAAQIHNAFDTSARPVALRRDGVRQAAETLAGLEARADADDATLEAARAELVERQAALAAIEAQREALPDAITALDQFSADRDPWQPLTREEGEVIADLLTELHAGYGDLVRHHVPRSASDLATLSLRTMITSAPDALTAIPEDELARINRDYRLPTRHQHQMFGLGGRQQSARDDHRGDILLLQLGYDDMMEWRWGEMGLFQFWISPEDAANRNWEAVQLTFECA
ncbi:DUF1963 domain-containing protein [Novosphingobium mangrovi (ex Huang et al. 2023)]|uniref:DUF1963 domain-containing protein n=1 Tax=Novosphingobium mangrovi (ex Huang et al. 2023) TaxID=2976432 RepID=A0ABT2I207_9SPHN|nr:DUF1963 domain-containing protein [Novosphingobium mangrovi (ex Huang et al. 2023)]MCT2398836.1 DUF1963 domain-containing protein [Novosphingobium mangrovi (ex Huang et al. 2023)]